MATVDAAEVIPGLNRMADAAARDLTINKIPHCYPFPFAQSYTVPAATAAGTNAILRLLKFPAGSYIWGFRGTPTDMDTGTVALVYSILAIDDADATKVTLVSGSTNGQAAAGSDSLLAASYGRYVGGYWLAIKVTTPANVAAAGTYKLAMQFSIGVINRAKFGTYLYDAEV